MPPGVRPASSLPGMTTTDGSGRAVVRRARPAELEAVGALTLQAYRVDGYVSDEADYVRELLGAATRDADAELWVAVEGGGDRVEGPAALLGTVTFCPLGSPFREVAVDDSEAEFRMLAVAPAARRRGVARLLTQRCLDRAREDGQARLVLCSDRRMTSAHALYASLGFRRLAERDWTPAPHIELIAYGVDL